MGEYRVYLDTSAIAKRYLEEIGSNIIDRIYELAEQGNVTIVASVWNIGEVLGVFTKRRSRGELKRADFETRIVDFLLETLKLIRMNSALFIPILSHVLLGTIKLILKYYIYEADALQVVTAKLANANLFLSADESLVNTAKNEGIPAYNVEKEEDKILEWLKSIRV